MTLQLEGRQEYISDDNSELIEENRRLKLQVRQMDEALRMLRIEKEAIASGIQDFRNLVGPLYKTLRLIHGEMDAMGIHDSVTQSSSPASNARTGVWEKWVAKLGGHRGSFLQALLDHGPSSAQQVKVAMGINRMGTVYDTATQLSKLGLITKSGDRYSLKE